MGKKLVPPRTTPKVASGRTVFQNTVLLRKDTYLNMFSILLLKNAILMSGIPAGISIVGGSTNEGPWSLVIGLQKLCMCWPVYIHKCKIFPLTKGGIIPLLEGGITTRKSGFLLFIPRLPPGGGGDLLDITFPNAFPPDGPSRPGEALGFTNPLPEKGEKIYL